jgi:hypothetical protein
MISPARGAFGIPFQWLQSRPRSSQEILQVMLQTGSEGGKCVTIFVRTARPALGFSQNDTSHQPID